jgi:quinol monooxygenase YgiN
MIFIVVKYAVKPEAAEQWIDTTREFTEATRAEPGNLWFDWYRSPSDPNEYVLVEAFRDPVAGTAHVSSPHFAAGLQTMRPLLVKTPSIVSQNLEGVDGWVEMGELKID